MKFILFTILNCILSYFISQRIVESKTEFETIKTKFIQVEYISLHQHNRTGEQPQITIQAREDFAGINMTDGNRNNISLWCNKNGAIIND